MKHEIEIAVQPEFVNDSDHHRALISSKLKINKDEITALQIVKRSIDARSKRPVFRLQAVVYLNEIPQENLQQINFQKVDDNKRVIIVGSGPGGLFAALRLIELGIKPIILERGKDVQTRRRDLKAIQQNGIVDPNSNYCFGEGGAGTYSDGKLYTRSTKRGDVNRILNLLVQHGAHQDIMIDAHPHIGSNKLPKIVESIRETILKYGGEIIFDAKVTDLLVKNNEIIGAIYNDNIEVVGGALILAAGHSARDIYYLLHNKNIKIESKPFAMGVRIEHPQSLIDEIQYHSKNRNPNLPASIYNLACQVDDHGVYSFCMCPGGIIIPASTSQEELVLNGMSVSRRDSPFANSGFVVSIEGNDWKHKNEFGVFAGLEYQKEIENIAWVAGGRTQRAPAQRITDFVNNQLSSSLPNSSYIPGTVSSPLHEILPKNIVYGLQKALVQFDKKMKGYFTEEAQILAAETRTSSPIKIPRDKETFMHVECKGLFPCGEGAGYAGGIVSAAIDGEKCAEGAAKFL
jgi:hypothetical protein